MLYLNGEILSETDAQISPDDRGFLLADGCFTTLKCENGNPVALTDHYQRLMYNTTLLCINFTLKQSDLATIIDNLLSENNLSSQNAIVRITITRGLGKRGLDIASNTKPTVMIRCFKLPELSTTPRTLCLTPYIRNELSPLSQCKTLNYMDNILARHYAKQHGVDDGILLNTKGHVVCTSSANIYIKKNGELYTPSIESGALPGIMRKHVLKHTKEPVHEVSLSQDMLANADEVLISNSVIGLQPVDLHLK